ncbi:MAG: S1C family serine protease [Alphaproteobacteria bacterium]
MESLPPKLTRRAALFLPAALGACGPAIAQRGLPDFADLAQSVIPAVVSIQVTTRDGVPPEWRNQPRERNPRDPSRRRGPIIQGAGSGFIIEPSGIIVTNAHVLGEAANVLVGLHDGSEYPATIIGIDELTDIALLKIEAQRPLSAVSLGHSRQMRVGQWVLAAGNPYGLGGSVTSGIISAIGRDIRLGPFDDFIQTDAPINPGNSGGPLFNMAGEVIGITTLIFSPSGASAGIGFAVPSDLARPVIEQLLRGGRVERGWLGVSVGDVEAAPGRPPRGGAQVLGVERGSPAARSGLRQGDVITSVDGARIGNNRDLVRGISAIPPGQNVRLSLLREGRVVEINVQVGRRPGPG